MVGAKERAPLPLLGRLARRSTLVHVLGLFAEELLKGRVGFVSPVGARRELTPLTAVWKRRTVRLPANPQQCLVLLVVAGSLKELLELLQLVVGYVLEPLPVAGQVRVEEAARLRRVHSVNHS
jgi:hypothetical protein